MTGRPNPFWNYQDLFLFLACGFPCLMAAGFIAFAGAVVFPFASEGVRLVMAQFVGYALWFAALWLILNSRYHAPFWRSLEWNWPAGRALSFFAGGVFVAVMVGVTGSLLKTPTLDSPMEKLMDDPMSGPLIALFAVTLGPVCEELAFRGFLLPLVARSFGNVAGIVISAIPFALLHGPQYSWSWRHVLLVMAAGAVFGWIRISTGSTGASTMVHAGYNGMFIAIWLATRHAFGDSW